MADRLRTLQRDGMLRDETRVADFEDILKLIAYNTGGLQSSSIIREDLIDHYIPFLPLEKKHVAMCVRREFRRHGRDDVSDSLVE